MNLTNVILLGLTIILTACVYFLDRQNDKLRKKLNDAMEGKVPSIVTPSKLSPPLPPFPRINKRRSHLLYLPEFKDEESLNKRLQELDDEGWSYWPSGCFGEYAAFLKWEKKLNLPEPVKTLSRPPKKMMTRLFFIDMPKPGIGNKNLAVLNEEIKELNKNGWHCYPDLSKDGYLAFYRKEEIKEEEDEGNKTL